MQPTEFETVSSDNDSIIVRHIHSGITFTYEVGTNPSGERLLQPTSMQGGEGATGDPQHIFRSAQTYAQLQMEMAGKVKPKLLTGGRIKR